MLFTFSFTYLIFPNVFSRALCDNARLLSSALAIGDERGRTARLRLTKVPSHHTTPIRQLHWLKVP